MRPRHALLEGMLQEVRGGALAGVRGAAAHGRPPLLHRRPGQAHIEGLALAEEERGKGASI